MPCETGPRRPGRLVPARPTVRQRGVDGRTGGTREAERAAPVDGLVEQRRVADEDPRVSPGAQGSRDQGLDRVGHRTSRDPVNRCGRGACEPASRPGEEQGGHQPLLFGGNSVGQQDDAPKDQPPLSPEPRAQRACVRPPSRSCRRVRTPSWCRASSCSGPGSLGSTRAACAPAGRRSRLRRDGVDGARQAFGGVDDAVVGRVIARRLRPGDTECAAECATSCAARVPRAGPCRVSAAIRYRRRAAAIGLIPEVRPSGRLRTGCELLCSHSEGRVPLLGRASFRPSPWTSPPVRPGATRPNRTRSSSAPWPTGWWTSSCQGRSRTAIVRARVGRRRT